MHNENLIGSCFSIAFLLSLYAGQLYLVRIMGQPGLTPLAPSPRYLVRYPRISLCTDIRPRDGPMLKYGHELRILMGELAIFI